MGSLWVLGVMECVQQRFDVVPADAQCGDIQAKDFALHQPKKTPAIRTAAALSLSIVRNAQVGAGPEGNKFGGGVHATSPGNL